MGGDRQDLSRNQGARARRLAQEHYGLLQNRAMHVLSVAFPPEAGWDDPEKLRAALWTDPESTAILTALQAAVMALPDVVMGQRKAFTAFSREFQFASIRPMKGGKAVLGLALTPQDDPRLEAPKNEGWSERLKAKMVLERPDQIDAALLKQAWEVVTFLSRAAGKEDHSALNGEYSSVSHSISCSTPWRSCMTKRSTGPRSAGSAM